MEEGTGPIDVVGSGRDAARGENGDEFLREGRRAESEAEYRMIFEKAMVGIFRSTAGGKILNLNPAFARILGFDSPEETIRTIKDVGSQLYVNCEDRVKLLRLLEEKGMVEGFGTQFYRKDGSIIRVLLDLECIKDEQGGDVYLQGTLQDITKTKEAEEALREAEEKYRNIYENAIEGIFRTTPDGRIISVNPAFARMLGYETPADMAARIIDMGRQVFASERRRKEYMHLLSTQGVVRDFEAQVQCRDGSVQWVTINGRSAGGDAGNPPYYEGTIESITERKKLEAQLRHAQKMESIGTLAGA